MVWTASPEAETCRKWREVGGNHLGGVEGVFLRPQSATVRRYGGRKGVVSRWFRGDFAGFAVFAKHARLRSVTPKFAKIRKKLYNFAKIRKNSQIFVCLVLIWLRGGYAMVTQVSRAVSRVSHGFAAV